MGSISESPRLLTFNIPGLEINVSTAFESSTKLPPDVLDPS